MVQNKLADALVIVASTYERDGFPIQALHCYQALCEQQLPADTETRARLSLARLLTEHTLNTKEARTHLLRAQILVHGLIGNYCLKYEVHDQLATCYQLMGDEASELQAYAAVAEMWQSARGSSEWPAVCQWVGRMAQRLAAAHMRLGRPADAQRVAKEGLAFSEAHGVQQQRVVLLLTLTQLALGRWDPEATDGYMASLRSLLGAADAATATGLGVSGHLHALLHYDLLQVMYMLRMGKVAELAKPDQQAKAREDADGPAKTKKDEDGPDVPPPPVLRQLDHTLQKLAAAQEQQQEEGAYEPYELPGLPTLEPLVCLLCAHVLRQDFVRPQLTGRYLARGLAGTEQLLRAAGVAGPDTREEELARQQEAPAATALSVHLLLLGCRAQILMSKAELTTAREEVLSCQQWVERFPRLLAPLTPGVHLLTGQYCVAMGDAPAAAAHFKAARLQASTYPSAALAAILEAQAHLSLDDQQQQQQQQGQGQQQGQQGGPGVGLSRAIEALGPLYIDRVGPASARRAGGGGAFGALPGSLGYVEAAAQQMVSGACLAQQGLLGTANRMLSEALRMAHRRTGNMQLVCCILCELVPTCLGATAAPDTNTAREAANSSHGFGNARGEPWAKARSKRMQVAIALRERDTQRAAGNMEDAKQMEVEAACRAAEAAEVEKNIAAAAAEAKADGGRHSYATGWRLNLAL